MQSTLANDNTPNNWPRFAQEDTYGDFMGLILKKEANEKQHFF